MVKSPEEYLSALNFDPPEQFVSGSNLSPAERTFVEKYMGFDLLRSLPRLDPQPMVMETESREAPVMVAEPEILVSPKIVVAPAPEPVNATVSAESAPPVLEPVTETLAEELVAVAEVAQVEETAEIVVEDETALVPDTTQAEIAPARTLDTAPAGLVEQAGDLPQAELSIKEILKQQAEVQAVSFYIGEQLFLLPVEGIQEVLRHMELIRVPQAPPFVAGVINLRGKVTPLVHLSAILTNLEEHIYDPQKHFVIICGTEPMQIGLIIDRINSMHLLPQDKIIWNVEAKLGETADFLYAIVNLDEKVIAMVAPENITRKILSAEI